MAFNYTDPAFAKGVRDLIQRSSRIHSALEPLIAAVVHKVSIGGSPGFGSAQVDSYTRADNVDPSNPMTVSYLIPSSTQRVVSAKLSWRLNAYRTYSSLSLTATGNASVGHTHASATHRHDMFQIGNVPPASTNTTWFAGPSAANPIVLITPNVGTTSPLETYDTSPGATGGQSVTHTHTVSGSTTLGIALGASATGITIQFDGTDHTAALGGPWSTDVVELDVTPFIALTPTAAWHVISLGSTTLGQIETHLKIGLYVAAASV